MMMLTAGLGSRHTLAWTAGLLLAGGIAFGATAAPAGLGDFRDCPAEAQIPAPFAGRAQCATLTVPEDRGTAGSRMIELPVLRLRAAGGQAGPPVFVLNGGPGEPNLGSVRPWVRIGQDHDLIYVGYRGADGSTVLHCPELAATSEAVELASPANLRAFEAAGAACSQRLQDSGIDLARYTILDVIDDLETVRIGLGREQVDLLSFSYGTRVAQYYARRHPGRIHRSVMIGVNPPGHFVFRASVNDRVLGRLSELCATDPWCSARTPDLRRSILDIVQQNGPRGDQFIDTGRTQLALFFALYSRKGFRSFAEAVFSAEHGDWAPLVTYRQGVGGFLKTQVWGDLLAKGGFDVWRYPQFEATFAATADSMGSPGDLLYQAVGRRWPLVRLPEEYDRAAPDPTETLLINGDIDVATPLEFARAELLPQLPNGRLLELKDYGHGDIGRQGAAFDQLIAIWLASGQLDRSVLRDDPYVFGQ